MNFPAELLEDKVLSQALLWDILESITDAVITIDEDHKVLLCNKAAQEMFGYPCDEIAGKDASLLIPVPHQSIHRQYVDRYITTRIPRVIGKSRECFATHREGKTFPIEISYSVSSTADRLYFTAVIRDISKRKDLEREFRFMEKLAGVGKAVAQVVHEIRKPLMLIGGFARQVEHCELLKDSDKDRNKLNIIVEEVRRLETLLNGIRLLTRPTGAKQRRSVSLNQVLRETVELLEPMLQSREELQLEVNLSSDPLLIQADPDQLKQVFLNLLQNAIEAQEGPGAVKVTSRGTLTRAEVSLEDHGPGIPEELREKIFDPFFTTKSSGTGLGLAISRNIIQDHGGALQLQSVIPHGTRFVIELPLDFP